MEKYIQPSIKVKEIDIENLLQTQSPTTDVPRKSEDAPAAGDGDDPNHDAKQNFNSWSNE